ncbi:MAG: hypothetical protein AAFQ94_06075 [Bacteroidota bacterium]
MRKIYALILLTILLVNLFGSIVANGFHELAHLINDSHTIVSNQGVDDHLKSKVLVKQHVVYHDHGHGLHTHDSKILALLKTFDYAKLASLMKQLNYAFIVMLNFKGFIEIYSFSHEDSFFYALDQTTVDFPCFLSSAFIDIPTPPPRVII